MEFGGDIYQCYDKALILLQYFGYALSVTDQNRNVVRWRSLTVVESKHFFAMPGWKGRCKETRRHRTRTRQQSLGIVRRLTARINIPDVLRAGECWDGREARSGP
jgi:hypothetical protein